MITEKANIAEANPTMQHAQLNLSFLEGKNLFIYNCYFL
jgi:hypothetical protein